MEFTVFDSPDLESDDYHTKRRFPCPSPLSDEAVDMMSRWITDCAENHQQCFPPAKPWVPTRLLEVKSTSDGTSFELRLIETTLDQSTSKYAAPNHMWGDITVSRPLRALKANMERLWTKISPDDLPRNFADAAHVCLRLGIPYLWIDSLCIDQDSPEDWDRESRLMHAVYRQAQVTIVATSAASSHDGFLERDLSESLAVKVTYSTANKDQNDYMVITRYKRESDNLYRFYAVDGTSWNTRGWTMQERSLSTRSIHFCRESIFFECRACPRTEGNDPVQDIDLRTSFLWPRQPSMSHVSLYRHWELALFNYTDRALTNGGDKLRAIHSVAEEVISATGWQYLHFAGMWRHTLACELLWCMPMDDAVRPFRSRAPSWSWAAMDGNSVILQVKPRKPSTAETMMPESMKERLLGDPFQILDVYEKRPGHISDNIRGYLEVMALTKPISSLVQDTSQDSFRMATPFNLVCEDKRHFEVEDGDIDHVPPMEKVFAPGRLDSGSLGQGPGYSELRYTHIGVDTLWNGLIVERHFGATAPSVELWRRVGVAQLYNRDGSTIMLTVFDTVGSRVKLILV